MTTLRVQRRNMETKAKKLRREGYVTGNLFGKEIEGSIPVQIEKSEAERIQRECMKGSQLYFGTGRKNLRCTDQRDGLQYHEPSDFGN